MELIPDQRKKIYGALHDAYDPDSLKIMFYIYLDKHLEDVVDIHKNFMEQLWIIIMRAEGEGWLLNLLDAAAAFRPEKQELIGFVKKFKAEIAPAVLEESEDPFCANFLCEGNQFPFVDREPIREAVKMLCKKRGAKRVLLIEGNKGTGKTYIYQYLRFLSSKFTEHKPYYIDLADDYLHVFDHMTFIAGRMGTDPNSVPRQEAQVARWAKLLAEWLISEANKKHETWWIVIDNFGDKNLQNDMEALIKCLITEIDRDNTPLRLVLLDFGGKWKLLPPAALNSVEDLEIGLISKLDLVDFFRDLRTNLEDDALEATAQLILDHAASAASSDPGKYMRQVWLEVDREYRILREETLT